MAYKIFISHTTKDDDLAQDLARRLKEAGGRVVSPKRGRRRADSSKSDLDLDLERLSECDEVIFLLTDQAAESPRLAFDAGAAFSLRKQVTPITVSSSKTPSILQSVKSIKYSELPAYIADLRGRAEARKKRGRVSHSSSKKTKTVQATASLK